MQPVSLAPFTTLELGGPARRFVEATSLADLEEGLRWATAAELPLALLGGGSNVVVADAGFAGAVVRLATRGISIVHETPERGGHVLVTAAAGEPWDELVERTVAAGWAGLECLSGIPGTVGATPIQNVGAYGQEVAETIRRVDVLDRVALRARALTPAELRFAYRDSALRRRPGRHVVTAVTYALRPGGAPTLRYAELRRALGLSASAAPESGEATPSLAQVRAAVLALRRAKSMVIDATDPNRRSAGSFFTNPMVSPRTADLVARRAIAHGAIAREDEMPRFPASEGLVKLAAGWLVERAGFPRGLRRGAVGLSSAHALALVHHGGGSTAELVALAEEIARAVRTTFGITLHPEPVFLGFAEPPLGGTRA